MRLNKVTRDGESQSAALYLGARHSEVSLEDTVMIPRVDATSEITHKHCDVMFVMLFGTYDDASIFRRIAYGIAQQIGEHPSYLLAIYIQLAYFLLRVFHLYVDMEFVGLHLIGLDGIVDEFDRPCYMRLQLQRPALHLCHVE